MNTRLILLICLIILWGCNKPSGKERPNFIFILSDDHRADVMGCIPGNDILTPSLDRLVSEGMRFQNCYAEFPSCAPSRGSIFTGCSGFTHQNIYPHWSGIPLNSKLITWPQAMREAGYETYYTGKWNSGGGGPEKYGFEKTGYVFVGGMRDHQMQFKDGNGEVSGFSSHLFTNALMKYLDNRSGNQPFFAVLSFTAPHDPRTPPSPWDEYYQPDRIPLPGNFMPVHPFNTGYLNIRDELLLEFPRTPEKVRKEIADYYGTISDMDQQIGKVLDLLKKRKKLKNTYIIYASDNGLAIGSHGLLGKTSMYDHSVKVPLVIRGPGIPTNEVSDALVCLYDLFPTVCDAAGIAVPGTVEGRSFLKVARGKEIDHRDHIFCANGPVQRMVTDGKHKYIAYHFDYDTISTDFTNAENRQQFFNLDADPLELHDLINDEASQTIIRKLKVELGEWQTKNHDFILQH